jgi:tetratricopeptide (TPR) repeat protein
LASKDFGRFSLLRNAAFPFFDGASGRIGPVVRAAFTIVLAAAILGAQESRPASRPASRPVAESRPRSLRDLADLGGDLVDAVKGDGGWGKVNRLSREGFELQQQGRIDEALACFERIAEEVPDARTISWLMIVSVHLDRGDVDAAVDAVERDLAAPGGDAEDHMYAYRSLAEFEERRGNFAKALDAWKQASPVEGAEMIADSYGEAYAQEFGIARCEFRLGRVDAALRRFEAGLKKLNGLGKDDPYEEIHRGEASKMAFLYVEDAGRAGRIAEAKTFAATLTAEVRGLVLDAIRIVDAWLTRDPAVLAKVLAGMKPDGEQVEGAGRLMGELGAGGIAWLARGIETGDPMAIRMAATSGRRELLPALDKRAAAAGPDAETLDEAIRQLDAATTRPASRPSSRPASRPAK